jgi:hypothetical protein
MGVGHVDHVNAQIVTELAGGTRIISVARLVEDGYRAVLVYVPGLFRIDVAPMGDTLRTVMRNLSDRELSDVGRTPGYVRGEEVTGELVAFSPSQVDIGFTLDDGKVATEVRGTIGVLWLPRRHTAQFTAQIFVTG